MTYQESFDHLGNQIEPPKPDWQHKLIRTASVITIVVCLFILVWGR